MAAVSKWPLTICGSEQMSKSPNSSGWVAFVLGHVIQPAAQTSDFFFFGSKIDC